MPKIPIQVNIFVSILPISYQTILDHDRFAVAAYTACLKICSSIIKAMTENSIVKKVTKMSDEKLKMMTKI